MSILAGVRQLWRDIVGIFTDMRVRQHISHMDFPELVEAAQPNIAPGDILQATLNEIKHNELQKLLCDPPGKPVTPFRIDLLQYVLLARTLNRFHARWGEIGGTTPISFTLINHVRRLNRRARSLRELLLHKGYSAEELDKMVAGN